MAVHQDKQYDVFLCHRGPDTKRHFSIWLKCELERQKLQVFFDDRSLQMGNDSPQKMDSAMQTATCGVVVLSPSFFASQWCMKELRTFLDRGNCLPACYDVTPYDINAENIKNKAVWEQHGGQLWTECRMTEANWTRTVQDLATVCMSVEKKFDDYEDSYADAIVRDVCQRLGRPCTTGKRVNMTPYRDNTRFVGRDRELVDLEIMLRGDCGCVCIHGMGGAGKTQLALKYVYSHKSQYDKLLWIDASKEALHSNFLGLAKPLGIDLGAEKKRSWLPSMLRPTQDKDRDIVAEIRTALEQLETPCLLVLDNVDDEWQYPGYLPREGPCHVILTARQRMPGNFHVLELKNLEEASACELLRSGLSPETPNEKIKELAVALGCHALSLAVSARLMFKGRHGPEWLLTKLRTTEAVAVFDGVPDDPDFQRKFAVDDSVSYKSDYDGHRQLRGGGGGGGGSGQKASMDYTDGDIEAASGLLVEHALAERSRDGGTAFHPLVQSFGRWEGKKAGDHVAKAVVMAIADVAKVREDTEHVAHAVSMALPDGDNPSSVRVQLDEDGLLKVIDIALPLAEIYANSYQTVEASSILDRCERVLQRVEPQDTSHWFRLWCLHCECFRREGKYVEAEALYRLALASSEARMGRDHLGTAMISNNLASVLHSLGKFVEAVALHRRALTIVQAELGPDHPYTMSVISNLALALGDQGDYRQGEALYRQALASCEARLGHDHLQTALICGNLALMLPIRAEALNRQVLMIREIKLGPDHPDTATSVHNLASVLQMQGKYREAEALHRRALVIRKAQLGPDHPNSVLTMNHVASGKYGEAEALNRRALAIQEAKLGPDHLDIAKMILNLALELHKQGQYGEAEALNQRGLAIQEAKLGLDHPDTATGISNLALVLHEQGRYGEAEALLRQVLAIRDSKLGPDHRDTADTFNDLAFVMENQGKYGKAEVLHRRALASYEAKLGPDHPATANSFNNLAMFLHKQGKLGEAEPLIRRALAIREAKLGPDHPDTGTSLNNLAITITEQHKYNEAEAVLSRALAIWEATLGPDHPNTATAFDNLAVVMRRQGKYDEAVALHRRALASYKAQLGPDHLNIAYSLNNLATVLQEQGKLDEAEALAKRALAIREAKLGPDHPDIGQSLNNLAMVMLDQHKYDEAEALFRRALAIWETILGPDHLNTVTAFDNLALVLQEQGKLDKAEALHIQALAIREAKLGPDHPDTGTSLNNLAMVMAKQCKYGEAEAEALSRRALAIWERRWVQHCDSFQQPGTGAAAMTMKTMPPPLKTDPIIDKGDWRS
eukprot:jgi/Chlat1/3606/Chrsp235S03604